MAAIPLRLGAITALRREAALLSGTAFEVVQSGVGAERAYAAARSLAARCDALLSFGFAGGIDPALPAGTLLLPETVLDEHAGHWSTDAALRALLAAALPDAATAPLVSVDAVAETPAAKHELATRHGASAVDMESAAIATAAADAGLPCVVLRAVGDPAGTRIPRSAWHCMDAAGNLRLHRLPGLLLRHPGDLPALLRLARHDAAAARALRRAARVLAHCTLTPIDTGAG